MLTWGVCWHVGWVRFWEAELEPGRRIGESPHDSLVRLIWVRLSGPDMLTLWFSGMDGRGGAVREFPSRFVDLGTLSPLRLDLGAPTSGASKLTWRVSLGM